MQDIIDQVRREFREINDQLMHPDTATQPDLCAELGKKRAVMEPLIDKIESYEKVLKNSKENAQIINEDADPEMTAMAIEENASLAAQLPLLEKQLEVLLLPQDPHDIKDIMVEIRAGAGGDESSLFAGDLLRMYLRFAETKGWRTQIISESRNDLGGYKEVTCEVVAPTGADPVYRFLKYESGVHRVQRIPETEKQGRTHTSTATVAILPEVEELDLVIEDKDLRIDTFASSGPGGQSVNTTMSAVRITHIPTNTVVSCQDGKSQHKNKDSAMKVLRARILQKQEDEKTALARDERRSQVGTGDRSEKIRTYNIPQDRVTDHRIKRNWSNVEGIFGGNIDEIVEALLEEDIKIKLDNRTAETV